MTTASTTSTKNLDPTTKTKLKLLLSASKSQEEKLKYFQANEMFNRSLTTRTL